MDYLKFKQEIDKQRSKEHNHDRVCVALEALEQGLPRIEHEAAGNYYSDYDSDYGTEDDEPGGYYDYASFVKPKANEKQPAKKAKKPTAKNAPKVTAAHPKYPVMTAIVITTTVLLLSLIHISEPTRPY